MRLLLIALLLALLVGAVFADDTGVELLMKSDDNFGLSDSTTWKRGDIINVKPFGHPGWGRREHPDSSDNFVVIRVPEMTLAEAESLVFSVYADSSEGGELVRLRKYRADWEALPDSIWYELATTGWYTATVEQVRFYMKDMEVAE